MIPRIMGDDDNIVISRPGYDATNPALADANKIFDSDWAFGGAIIDMGTKILPTNEGVGGTHSFSFPAQAFVPAAVVFGVSIPGYYYGFTGSTISSTFGIAGAPMYTAFRDRMDPDGLYRFFPHVTESQVIFNDWLPRVDYVWEAAPNILRFSPSDTVYYYSVGYIIFAF